VGPRGVAEGTVELTTRRGLLTEEVAIDDVVARLTELIGSQRQGD
jgi:hypothetical protein